MRAPYWTLAVLLAACQPKAEEPESRKTVDVPLSAQIPGQASAAPVRAVTELEIVDTKVGEGEAAKTGDTVKVHYTGRLLTGKKFDSSLDAGQPFEFTLGKGAVIKGWDEGVVGMKPGGQRKLTIPAEKAYGERGSGKKIPPNSSLEFDIELLEIVK